MLWLMGALVWVRFWQIWVSDGSMVVSELVISLTDSPIAVLAIVGEGFRRVGLIFEMAYVGL